MKLLVTIQNDEHGERTWFEIADPGPGDEVSYETPEGTKIWVEVLAPKKASR